MQKKRGISLIVLVITIIVMIILAAAIIISLTNNGIIEKASNAVNEYNDDEANHVATLAWSEAYISGVRDIDELKQRVRTGIIDAGLNYNDYGLIVTTRGVNVIKGWIQDGLLITKGDVTLEVGDLIQYNAGVSGYTGAWKILGAKEDGKLLIMSTKDVDSLFLYGLTGNDSTNYGVLNGISRLDELCEPYGHGEGAVGARSIKVEDIDKLTGYDPKTYEVGHIYEYGNSVSLTWSATNSGKLNYTTTNNKTGTFKTTHSEGFFYVDYNTMKRKSVVLGSNTIPLITNTSYKYNVSQLLSSVSQKATEMIVGSGSDKYWLASTFTRTSTNAAYFGLKTIKSSSVDYSYLFYSDGYKDEAERGVRAVVELSNLLKAGTKDATNGWSYTI